MFGVVGDYFLLNLTVISRNVPVRRMKYKSKSGHKTDAKRKEYLETSSKHVQYSQFYDGNNIDYFVTVTLKTVVIFINFSNRYLNICFVNLLREKNHEKFLILREIYV